eukprot:m.333032 g.333032  ORF g.333032 m.333032 type:complete len:173 (+) comp17050_c0_seq1:180-698(+)
MPHGHHHHHHGHGGFGHHRHHHHGGHGIGGFIAGAALGAAVADMTQPRVVTRTVYQQPRTQTVYVPPTQTVYVQGQPAPVMVSAPVTAGPPVVVQQAPPPQYVQAPPPQQYVQQPPPAQYQQQQQAPPTYAPQYVAGQVKQQAGAKFCAACGFQSTISGARFCQNCGKPLPL